MQYLDFKSKTKNVQWNRAHIFKAHLTAKWPTNTSTLDIVDYYARGAVCGLLHEKGAKCIRDIHLRTVQAYWREKQDTE